MDHQRTASYSPQANCMVEKEIQLFKACFQNDLNARAPMRTAIQEMLGAHRPAPSAMTGLSSVVCLTRKLSLLWLRADNKGCLVNS